MPVPENALIAVHLFQSAEVGLGNYKHVCGLNSDSFMQTEILL